MPWCSTVKDEDENPLQNVPVDIGAVDDSSGKGSSTNANGECTLDGVEEGTYILLCDAIGYKEYKQTITVNDNVNLSIILYEAQNYTVSGVVKDKQGNPIPNVTMEFLSLVSDESTVTDTDGAYEIELEEGGYLIDISHSNFDRYSEEITVDQTHTTFDIELTAGNSVPEPPPGGGGNNPDPGDNDNDNDNNNSSGGGYTSDRDDDDDDDDDDDNDSRDTFISRELVPKGNISVRVTTAQGTKAVRDAVAQTTGTGTVTATIKNAGEVDLSTLREMAAASSRPVKLNADSMSPDGRSVEVRISFGLQDATRDLNLAASTTSEAAQTIERHFERFYSNNVSVVHLAQQGGFGQTVEIAARFDPALGTDSLTFYVYDIAANTYRQITTTYWVDANDYVHFSTDLTGDIIITYGTLERK